MDGLRLDPFATGDEIRCIGVSKTGSPVAAQDLMNSDPIVKVVRPMFAIHARIVEKNILP